MRTMTAKLSSTLCVRVQGLPDDSYRALTGTFLCVYLRVVRKGEA